MYFPYTYRHVICISLYMRVQFYWPKVHLNLHLPPYNNRNSLTLFICSFSSNYLFKEFLEQVLITSYHYSQHLSLNIINCEACLAFISSAPSKLIWFTEYCICMRFLAQPYLAWFHKTFTDLMTALANKTAGSFFKRMLLKATWLA